jgi:hypothetical protein
MFHAFVWLFLNSRTLSLKKGTDELIYDVTVIMAAVPGDVYCEMVSKKECRRSVINRRMA